MLKDYVEKVYQWCEGLFGINLLESQLVTVRCLFFSYHQGIRTLGVWDKGPASLSTSVQLLTQGQGVESEPTRTLVITFVITFVIGIIHDWRSMDRSLEEHVSVWRSRLSRKGKISLAILKYFFLPRSLKKRYQRAISFSFFFVLNTSARAQRFCDADF